MIVNEKFMQNPRLCDKLVESGQTNYIEATLDGFWGAKASITSKSIKQGTWSGANFLGKILAETRTELRRELGLPDLSVSNATTDMEVTPAATPTAAAPATAATVSSNQVSQSQQTGHQQTPVPSALSKSAGTDQRTSKKNKEHQSPIASPETSDPSNNNKRKKARVYSPKSELPPKKDLGDLFALPVPETDLTETVSMV